MFISKSHVRHTHSPQTEQIGYKQPFSQVLLIIWPNIVVLSESNSDLTLNRLFLLIFIKGFEANDGSCVLDVVYAL